MEYTLKLGESVAVRRGWLSRRRVIFAGEVSPGVYSIVAEWSEVHNSASYNIYFQKSQREFPLLDGRISILDATKHEIRFRFERRPRRDVRSSPGGPGAV
jgi:hypothetical protein